MSSLSSSCDCNTRWDHDDGTWSCKSGSGANIARRSEFCTSQTTEEGCNGAPAHDPGTCSWNEGQTSFTVSGAEYSALNGE